MIDDYDDYYDDGGYEGWGEYDDGCDCDDCLGVNAAIDSDSNSAAGSDGLSRGVSMYQSGYTFNTGNSVVAQLPEGSVLEVTGKGQLEILEVGVPQLQPGDRFTSKYGLATVVRPSSRLPVALGENEVLYIADGTNVVRRQFVN